MDSFVDVLIGIGRLSIQNFWFSIILWTILAISVLLLLRVRQNLNPLYHYHFRVAVMLSLPVALLTSWLIGLGLGTTAKVNASDSAFFVVQSPISLQPPLVTAGGVESSLPFAEPTFWFGIFSVLVALASIMGFIRLVMSIVSLHRLRTSLHVFHYSRLKHLNPETLRKIQSLTYPVSIATSSHEMVPFTFGWKKPIIVLPEFLLEDGPRLNMILTHELVHIRRRDYLIQLAVTLVNSAFWFHPVIAMGIKEIETYKEISCDCEVLNTSQINRRDYANLLFEMRSSLLTTSPLSLSMAVPSSSLKKRIETMKHHSTYKTSIKKSGLFLGLLVALITIPIACSDLQDSNLVNEDELINEKLTVGITKVEINGLEVANITSGMGNVTGPSVLAFLVPKVGVIYISPWRFEPAKQAGIISGNAINFKYEGNSYKFTSDSPFMEKNAPAWVFIKSAPDENITPYVVFTTKQTVDSHQKSERVFNQLLDTAGKEVNNTKNALPEEEWPEDVFVIAEEAPQMLFSMVELQSKIVYPEVARRAGIEGRVVVKFIVDENGDVRLPKIIRSVSAEIDQEALRVVSTLKFIPGKQRGRPVKVQISVPFVFRLSNAE